MHEKPVRALFVVRDLACRLLRHATRVVHRALPIWVILGAAVTMSVLYVAGFYLVRQRLRVTPFVPCKIYYFSDNQNVNAVLFDLYRPLHGFDGREPQTTKEWMIEQKNERVLYVRNIRGR